MRRKTCKIPKISCGHCVNTIETELKELPGILKVEASCETKSVSVEWDDSVLEWSRVEACLKEIGFPAD